MGVPASQGLTSPSTKYSDPMMQLCLTNMIAMYKSQGEPFLAGSAIQVYETITRQLEESPQENSEVLMAAQKILNDLLELKKEGGEPDFQKAISGTEPEKVLLRMEFAKQVAERKLIYISDGQINRPVQHALRGCNVIGLTGTATRNLTYVLASNGNTEAMKNVEAAGRQITAEVVYRWVKSLPEGLETPVKTYPTENTLKWLVSFARENSGYNFAINQAGICDTKSQKELVKALHAPSRRPIIFLDLETDKDSVMIDGMVKKMENLTKREREEVRERGFYYYHTPHARGTHFDIPTGSKGALMLSPTVNASDRDQAAYRPRELGEGHVVEPFISEKQKEILQSATRPGQPVTMTDLLKAQHETTLSDEEKEILSAYKLHITGQITLAAERAKEYLQIRPSNKMTQKGEWLETDKLTREKNQSKIEARTVVFKILEDFFIQDSGNEAFFRKLDKEIRQGGEVATQQYLSELIEGEIKRTERLMAQMISEIQKNQDKPDLVEALQMALNQIQIGKMNLEKEKAGLNNNWNQVKKQFPLTTPYIAAAQETAEVEADKESEEEKEMEVQNLAELQTRKRIHAAKNILEVLNEEVLSGIPDDMIGKGGNFDGTRLPVIFNILQTNQLVGNSLWKPNIFVSNRLKYQLKAGTLPEIKVVVAKKDFQTNYIGLVDAWEGDHMTSSDAYWLNSSNPAANSLYNGGVLHTSMEPNGDLKLVYTASAPLMKGIEEDLHQNKNLGEILLALIHVGITRLTEEQWSKIESYWKDLDVTEKERLKKSLEESLGKTNPAFLNQKVSLHLWNASFG
jgi:hypothetical protein